jgi:transcriptional regulator GlxA family with amidase domain
LSSVYYADLWLRRFGRTNEPGYQCDILAATPGPVRTSCGIELIATHSYCDVRDNLDTLVVAGDQAAEQVSKDDPALVEWVRAMPPRVRRVASICTGAFILASGGLLNHGRVTTHWLYSDALRPHTRRLMSIPAYSSCATEIFLEAKNRPDISELQAWILGNPGEDLSVAALADRMAMSPRNFARLFHSETGDTPAQFADRARADAARCKLEQTVVPVETIAEECGFGNAERTRRTFQRLFEVSPLDYRAQFRSTLLNSSKGIRRRSGTKPRLRQHLTFPPGFSQREEPGPALASRPFRDLDSGSRLIWPVREWGYRLLGMLRRQLYRAYS